MRDAGRVSGVAYAAAAFGTHGIGNDAIIAGTGLVSAFPLYWFSQGAKRIPMTTIGFLQYVSPSIMLLFSIFVFKETFTPGHLVFFSLIWGALITYSYSLVREIRGARAPV